MDHNDKHAWKEEARCRDYDVELFFDKYEEDEQLRKSVDDMCAHCPVARQCFAVGISQKEWGIWGGIYIENGKISREFNRHRSKTEWAKTWQDLTIDK